MTSDVSTKKQKLFQSTKGVFNFVFCLLQVLFVMEVKSPTQKFENLSEA